MWTTCIRGCILQFTLRKSQIEFNGLLDSLSSWVRWFLIEFNGLFFPSTYILFGSSLSNQWGKEMCQKSVYLMYTPWKPKGLYLQSSSSLSYLINYESIRKHPKGGCGGSLNGSTNLWMIKVLIIIKFSWTRVNGILLVRKIIVAWTFGDELLLSDDLGISS